MILNKETSIKYLRFHQFLPFYEQAGSLKYQHPEIRCMTVPPLVWFTPTHCLFSPIRVLWKDRITLPAEIYELPVWYTITATAHHIIFPEGLLQPMSSHLYLWQFKRDLVRPHFDKSHLKLINMGDTLPPRLGFSRRDLDLHCHSTCIVQEEEEERKGQRSRKEERKESGHMAQRRIEGEMETHTGWHLGCGDWTPCACRALISGLPGRIGIRGRYQLRERAWWSTQEWIGHQALWAIYFLFKKHC